MPSKKTAGDRARARERNRIEAEQITGVSGLTQRESDAVMRAHRAGDDPMAAVPASERTGNAARPLIAKEHANHLIPQRVLDVEQPPITVEGIDMQPIGVLLGGVNDFKILRGTTASVNLTTSLDFAHMLTDVAGISRGNILAVALYQVPRPDWFGDTDTGDDTADADTDTDTDTGDGNAR